MLRARDASLSLSFSSFFLFPLIHEEATDACGFS